MSKRRHVEEEHENEERWLLTYADLITLLMVFFVVMYSLSRVDAEKFKVLAVTLSDAFHTPRVSPIPLPGVGGRKGTDPTNEQDDPAHPQSGAPTPLQKLGLQLQDIVKKEGLDEAVTIVCNGGGHKLLIRLSDSLMFAPGNATLTPEARTFIAKVAPIIGKVGKQVRVEGHTDNVPIHTALFESNWQLSTARASNVILELIQNHGLPPEMLAASGYGEYRPIAANDTLENRAKNRRVEFVITDEDRDE